MQQNNLQLLPSTDLAYMAGLIDGEGSILLRGNGTAWRHPALAFASTTDEMTSWAMNLFGGKVYDVKSRGENRKPIRQWLATRSVAMNALEVIVPYMKEPKKLRRARHLLENYIPNPTGILLTEEQKLRREEFEEEFFQL